MGKRVAVTGSSGLIGGALRRHLTARGDTVLRIVRRDPQTPDEVGWDPSRGELDGAALEGVDAGEVDDGVGIGDKRWNAEHKREVERSRTDATGTVAQTLARVAEQSGRRIRLVNASAVGFYGATRCSPSRAHRATTSSPASSPVGRRRPRQPSTQGCQSHGPGPAS